MLNLRRRSKRRNRTGEYRRLNRKLQRKRLGYERILKRRTGNNCANVCQATGVWRQAPHGFTRALELRGSRSPDAFDHVVSQEPWNSRSPIRQSPGWIQTRGLKRPATLRSPRWPHKNGGAPKLLSVIHKSGFENVVLQELLSSEPAEAGRHVGFSSI